MVDAKNNTLDSNNTEHNQAPNNRRYLRRKTVALGVVFLFLAAVCALVLIFYRGNENSYVFVIDGKKYSKAEVKEQTKYPVEIEKKNQSSAAADLYELLYTIKAAESLNMDLSDKAISSQKQQILKDQGVEKANQEKYNDWFVLLAKYRTTMQATASDEVEGYMYDFYFGHHIEHGPKYRPDNLGNEQLISQDKKYAKERAEYYRSALDKGELTPEAALKEVQQDTKLNQGGSLVSNKTRQFKSVDGSSWKEQLFNTEDRISVIERLKVVNHPSDIEVSKALASPDAKEKEDMSYYFVYLTVASSSKVASGDLSKALKEIKASYKGY